MSESASLAPSAAPPPVSFFYGTGSLGLGLALALQARGWPVAGAWNRHAERAAAAQALLGLPVQHGPLPAPPPCDLVWVTVSDDAIAPVGQALAAAGLPKGCVVAHTSGCLAASALSPGGPDVLRGSLHPLLACPTPERARDGLGQGAFFALEGDAGAVAMLQRVVLALGGEHAVLEAAAKPRYHAAAVLASNLVVALLDLAGTEAQAAGLQDAAPHLARFARGALEHAAALGTVRGLTGPAVRGDARTLQAHVGALSSEALPIYRALSARALAMAQARGLTPQATDAARRALDTPSV